MIFCITLTAGSHAAFTAVCNALLKRAAKRISDAKLTHILRNCKVFRIYFLILQLKSDFTHNYGRKHVIVAPRRTRRPL